MSVAVNRSRTASVAMSALFVGVALAGCAPDAPTPTNADSGPGIAGAPSETPDSTTDLDGTIVAQLGSGYTYADGLSIAVSRPKRFSPSETAVGVEAKKATALFELTLTNKTERNVDPNLITVTASSGGVEASGVFDAEKRIGGAPQTTVRSGKSITWKQAFSLANLNDITMDVNPDFTRYDTVTFVSK